MSEEGTTEVVILNEDIAEIQEAMDKDAGEGRDEQTARQKADIYIAAHPEEFRQMEALGKDIPALVRAVELFRDAGMFEDQWKVEAWILHKFESQNIGGAFEPTIRIPTLLEGSN